MNQSKVVYEFNSLSSKARELGLNIKRDITTFIVQKKDSELGGSIYESHFIGDIETFLKGVALAQEKNFDKLGGKFPFSPVELKDMPKHNLRVIENFILYVTHSDDVYDGTPMVFSPETLYRSAEDYIEEDHVDGKGNENFF